MAVVEEMGMCLAEMHPAETLALLETPPASPASAAAMKVLSPAFGACLRKDATLKTNAAGLRSAIALGVYHRMVDAPSSSGGSAAQ